MLALCLVFEWGLTRRRPVSPDEAASRIACARGPPAAALSPPTRGHRADPARAGRVSGAEGWGNQAGAQQKRQEGEGDAGAGDEGFRTGKKRLVVLLSANRSQTIGVPPPNILPPFLPASALAQNQSVTNLENTYRCSFALRLCGEMEGCFAEV